MSAMSGFVIPREMMETTLERILAPMVDPERVDRLTSEILERRIGAIPIEEAAARYGWAEKPFRRLLRRHGINVISFSKRKSPLVATADLARLIDASKRPLPRRRKAPAATE